MRWRYAINTISWEHLPLEKILSEAKAAGFGGIELFQHPDEWDDLNLPVHAEGRDGITKLLRLCDEFELELIGVCSGSFSERCRLVKDIAESRNVPLAAPDLPYVYVDEWRQSDPRFANAIAAGYRLALHPHMYKPVQTLREAEEVLKLNPLLRFIPDTAHLTIAGDGRNPHSSGARRWGVRT